MACSILRGLRPCGHRCGQHWRSRSDGRSKNFQRPCQARPPASLWVSVGNYMACIDMLLGKEVPCIFFAGPSNLLFVPLGENGVAQRTGRVNVTDIVWGVGRNMTRVPLDAFGHGACALGLPQDIPHCLQSPGKKFKTARYKDLPNLFKFDGICWHTLVYYSLQSEIMKEGQAHKTGK